MSTNLSTELQEQIQVFQEEMLPKIPKPILDTFAQATADLVRSGIAERAVLEGSKARISACRMYAENRSGFPKCCKKGPQSSPSIAAAGDPTATCSCGHTRNDLPKSNRSVEQ